VQQAKADHKQALKDVAYTTLIPEGQKAPLKIR
jgi:hypothetical protein